MNRLCVMMLMLSGLVACGCASGTKYAESVQSFPALQEGHGRIYFYRLANPFFAAVQPEIRVNDQRVGYSNPGGFFYIDRPAGEYTASVGTEVERKLMLNLKAGETKYVETDITMGFFVGQPRLTEVTESNGKSAMQECRYTEQGK